MLKIVEQMSLADFSMLTFYIVIGLVIVFIKCRSRCYGISATGIKIQNRYPQTFNVIHFLFFMVWLIAMCVYFSRLESITQ